MKAKHERNSSRYSTSSSVVFIYSRLYVVHVSVCVQLVFLVSFVLTVLFDLKCSSFPLNYFIVYLPFKALCNHRF